MAILPNAPLWQTCSPLSPLALACPFSFIFAFSSPSPLLHALEYEGRCFFKAPHKVVETAPVKMCVSAALSTEACVPSGVKGVPFCFVSSAVFVTSHIQNLRLAAAPGIVRLNTSGFGGRDPEADAHDRDDQPAHPRSLGDHRRTGFRLNFSVLCRRF